MTNLLDRLGAADTAVRFLGRIAQHEAVLHQLALDRSDCAAHPRVVRQKPDLRHQEEARDQASAAIGLHEAVLADVEALRANLFVDLRHAPRASARPAL